MSGKLTLLGVLLCLAIGAQGLHAQSNNNVFSQFAGEHRVLAKKCFSSDTWCQSVLAVEVTVIGPHEVYFYEWRQFNQNRSQRMTEETIGPQRSYFYETNGVASWTLEELASGRPTYRRHLRIRRLQPGQLEIALSHEGSSPFSHQLVETWRSSYVVQE